MNTPQINPVDVRTLLKAKGLTSLPGKPIVVGIRGYFRDSMGAKGKNDRGIYDDAFIIALSDHCVNFNGNTDPSAWRTGIACLTPGIWKFIAGKHHIESPPPRGYAAFRQYGDFTVTRDNKGLDTGDGFAINFHHGGEVGTSSLGCQTVPPAQWSSFRDTLYKELGTNVDEVMRHPSGVSGKVITYLLLTRDEAEKILGHSL